MQIMRSCRTGYHFAEAYVAAAQEQQGTQPLPSRMPTENEVSVLLNSLIFALKKLEDVRDMVQQNRIQNERARENGGRNADDEDVSMYGDGIKPPYSMHEVKKRRGVSLSPLVCAQPRAHTHIHKSLTSHLARGSSRPVPQLQQGRHAGMEAWPRRRKDPLQRMRPSLRQT